MIPRLIGIYGPTGSGKTVEEVYSGVGNAMFVGRPDSFIPARLVVGLPVEPAHIVKATTLPGATKALIDIRKNTPSWVKMVIVDDLSDMNDAHFGMIKPEYGGENPSGDQVFKLWMRMAQDVMAWRAAALKLLDKGMTVIVSGHARGSKEDEKTGELYRGGLHIASAKQRGEFAKKFTHMLRCVQDEDDRDAGRWGGRYWVEHNHQFWITKDRDGIFATGGVAPMNLAEHMRAAGEDWPRPPGFEWMEDWVAHVADVVDTIRDSKGKILAKAWKSEVVEMLDKELADTPTLIRRWIRRDGRDRSTITYLYQSSLGD